MLELFTRSIFIRWNKKNMLHVFLRKETLNCTFSFKKCICGVLSFLHMPSILHFEDVIKINTVLLISKIHTLTSQRLYLCSGGFFYCILYCKWLLTGSQRNLTTGVPRYSSVFKDRIVTSQYNNTLEKIHAALLTKLFYQNCIISSNEGSEWKI